MSIRATWSITCDHCGVHPPGNPHYRTYNAALHDLQQLEGWHVSQERDNSRYVFCPACLKREVRAIIETKETG